LRAALLQVEDGVGGISLRKERLFWLELDNFSSQSGSGEKGLDVKPGHLQFGHLKCSFSVPPSQPQIIRRSSVWGDHSPYGCGYLCFLTQKYQPRARRDSGNRAAGHLTITSKC